MVKLVGGDVLYAALECLDWGGGRHWTIASVLDWFYLVFFSLDLNLMKKTGRQGRCRRTTTPDHQARCSESCPLLMSRTGRRTVLESKGMCRVGDGPLAMLQQSDREGRCRPFIARLMIGSGRGFSHEIVN